MMLVTERKKMLGVSSGIVIEKNWRHVPAPSSCAASYTSGGIVFSPAPSTMILKPMLIQSPTIATTMRATHSVVIHRGPSIPKKRKTTLTR